MMHMSLKIKPWKLFFCAGYIVPPCKGLDENTIQKTVKGSSINIDSMPKDFFLSLFTEHAEKYPLDIDFTPEGGKQQNKVRSLIQSIAFDDPNKKEIATRKLAYRLANASDKRSPSGLFIVLAGRVGENTRVFLWKFPADESIQATVSDTGITIQFIQDVFSRKSTYFKAAIFEGTPASTSFWKGKVEDKQAKDQIWEASEFWIVNFLNAKPALTDTRGTKVLTRALRETIKQTKSLEKKEALVDASNVIKSQDDRNISIGEFAKQYLPEDVRSKFIKAAGGSTIADDIFKIDRVTMDMEFRLKSIVIDNLFTIRGPLDQFDRFVNIIPTDREGIVKVSLQGTITSRAILTR